MSVGSRAEKLNIVGNDHDHMQNCDFSVLDRKYIFEQVWSKNQNCQFKMKFSTKTNLNMQNSIVVFTFAVLDGNTLFRQV